MREAYIQSQVDALSPESLRELAFEAIETSLAKLTDEQVAELAETGSVDRWRDADTEKRLVITAVRAANQGRVVAAFFFGEPLKFVTRKWEQGEDPAAAHFGAARQFAAQTHLCHFTLEVLVPPSYGRAAFLLTC